LAKTRRFFRGWSPERVTVARPDSEVSPSEALYRFDGEEELGMPI